MNNINVIIYSYKSKFIKETINSIFSNVSDKSTVNVLLIDQNPIDRDKSLKELFNIQYVHVFWDNIFGVCDHKAKAISASNAEYLMILGENCILSKDWDIKFIDFIKDKNIILSGNKKIKIKNKNLFYIKKEYQESQDFELIQFIDRNFIFGKNETIKNIQYPNYLKFNAEEELLSIQFFVNNIDIFSVPAEFLFYTEDQPILHNYVPFSVNHNYNEMIKLFKYGKNKYIDVRNKKRNLLDFNKFHKFDFTSLQELPFNSNDVLYDPDNLNFNQVDARKFVAKTKAIH